MFFAYYIYKNVVASCGYSIIQLCLCLHQVRSRGLPEDAAGPIRIIDIEGVDANMCCGTHVSNLSHLQVGKVKNDDDNNKVEPLDVMFDCSLCDLWWDQF